MLLIQLCHLYQWVQASLQQKLWLRHLREHHMIRVMIRIFLLKSQITSSQCVKSGLRADVTALRLWVLTSIHFVTRYLVVCYQTLYHSLLRCIRKISLMQFLRKYQEFVKTLVSHLLLHHQARSLEHRLFLT